MGEFKIYTDNNGPFENDERSINVSEGIIHTSTVVGKFDSLKNNLPAVGDAAPGWVADNMGLRVLNCALSRESGEMGKLTLTLVKTNSTTRPYLVTATVDMQAVEKNLINHPSLAGDETQKQIQMWCTTDEQKQWGVDENGKFIPYRYWITVTVGDGSSTISEEHYEPVDDEWAKKYCYAVLRGVETYSIYLPVVEVTSKYLKLPGVSVDQTTHAISGTMNASDFDDIGTYNDPPFSLAGFTDGKWFKTVDRLTQEANGGWTRTEQWTYTNDLRFLWIYDDGVTKRVIQPEK